MKLLDYVLRLVPKFEKTRILDDIEGVYRINKECLIPSLETAESMFKQTKYSSELVTKYVEAFEKATRGSAKGGVIKGNLLVAKNSLEVLEFLKSLVEDQFGDVIVKDGLTFKKANILRYIEAIRFYSDYTRLFVRWLVTKETEAKFPADVDPDVNAFTPAQESYIRDNFTNYTALVELVAKSVKELSETFEGIPEALVNERSNGINSALGGAGRTDPFGFSGLIASKWDPFYAMGMAWNAWVINRYNAAVDERRALELRLLRQKELERNAPNPKTKEIIEYTETRLAKLNSKIKDMEVKYG